MSNRQNLDAVLRDNQNNDKDRYVDYFGKRMLSKEVEIVKEVMDTNGPNLFRMSSLKWSSDTAVSAANEAYPNKATPGDIPKAVKDWNNTDGHRDAFRHATLAALTAKEFTHHLGGVDAGVKWTGRLLHAHEGQATNNPVREAMDLYNNKVGLQIYKENPNADAQQLMDRVKEAIEKGRMVVINKEGKLAWSDQVPVYGHGNADHPVTKKKAMGEDGVQVASLDTGAPAARVANVLVDGNDRINNQFAQALTGTNGDRNTAALAVHTISQVQGYRETENIRIIEGRSGLVASQGDGATSINVQVPQGKPGDFERVSTQLALAQPAQTPNLQVAALEQTQDQTRKAPTV
jgi:hypothetical protein